MFVEKTFQDELKKRLQNLTINKDNVFDVYAFINRSIKEMKGSVNMHWQNIQDDHCPKCGKELIIEEENSRVLCIDTDQCKFTIGKEKYFSIKEDKINQSHVKTEGKKTNKGAVKRWTGISRFRTPKPSNNKKGNRSSF